MESLIVFLLIAAGSAVANWLKRRGETDWTEVELPPPPVHPPRRTGAPQPGVPPPQKREEPKMVDWEAELRRMLQPHEPAPPPPPPPPVIQHAPPPPRHQPPPPVFQPSPTPSWSRPKPKPIERPVFVEPEYEEGPSKVVTLNQANLAYDRASHMQESVRDHLEHITHKPVGTTSTVTRYRRSDDAVKAVRLLRTPTTARQVFVASMIFGPPKALENSW